MASLGNDLASIRLERNLSIEDVKQKTKIPLTILKSIEDDTIFDKMDNNNTYTRSYVRSYAKAVKIEDNDIVRALDQMQKGTYKGGLLKDTDIERRTSFEHGTPKQKENTETPTGDMVHDHSPEFSKSAEQAVPNNENTLDSASDTASKPPTVNTVDWAGMGKKFTPTESKSRVWLGIVVLMIFLAGAAFIVWYQLDGNDAENDEQIAQNETTQPAVDPDSLQLNLTAPVDENSGNLTPDDNSTESLPDTLRILIYAAYDKLEPVRVNTDVINSLNPYWIEQGDAFEFEFVNEIEFRGQYSRMALLFNGHVVENFRQQFLNPQTGMVEINRSFFEEDPRWLQPGPDSLSVPQPITIKERPIFN